MTACPPLIISHPRLPGIQLHRGPRTGEAYLLAVAVCLATPEDCVDAGEWLAEQGRQALKADHS